MVAASLTTGKRIFTLTRMHAKNERAIRPRSGYAPRRMARPKRNPDREKIVGVRMSKEELQLLQQAVAKELEGVTGATASVPKFMLAASLEKAKKVTGER